MSLSLSLSFSGGAGGRSAGTTVLTEALERLYMEELFEGRSARLVVDALTMRDKPGSLLGDGNPRSRLSLSRLMPICFGLEKSFFFFCFSGNCVSNVGAPARGNTTFAAVVATLGIDGGGRDGEGWLIRSGGGIRGGEALPLRRETRDAPSSNVGTTFCGRFICCMAAWAAIREAETAGIWSDEAVGKDGSKKPCEWCLDRCRGSSIDGPRPDGRRPLSCGMARAAC